MAEKAKQAVPDTCRLTLTIRGVDYRVTPVVRPFGRRAWRLRRADNEGTCVVAEGPDGSTCTCPDSEFRHPGPGSGSCKHVRACLAMRLIGTSD